MKDTKMNMKSLSIAVVLLSALTLSSCSKAPVQDDVRSISQEDKKGMLNAQTLPETTVAPSVQPSMGAGLVGESPAQPAEPIDKGTMITVPTVNEVTVEKNEKIKLYTGQLEVGSTITAVLFYSGGGQNDRTIDLGEATVDSNGEVTKEIVIPANLASGNYVISFNVKDALFTAPIKVG